MILAIRAYKKLKKIIGENEEKSPPEKIFNEAGGLFDPFQMAYCLFDTLLNHIKA